MADLELTSKEAEALELKEGSFPIPKWVFTSVIDYVVKEKFTRGEALAFGEATQAVVEFAESKGLPYKVVDGKVSALANSVEDLGLEGIPSEKGRCYTLEPEIGYTDQGERAIVNFSVSNREIGTLENPRVTGAGIDISTAIDGTRETLSLAAGDMPKPF